MVRQCVRGLPEILSAPSLPPVLPAAAGTPSRRSALLHNLPAWAHHGLSQAYQPPPCFRLLERRSNGLFPSSSLLSPFRRDPCLLLCRPATMRASLPGQ